MGQLCRTVLLLLELGGFVCASWRPRRTRHALELSEALPSEVDCVRRALDALLCCIASCP